MSNQPRAHDRFWRGLAPAAAALALYCSSSVVGAFTLDEANPERSVPSQETLNANPLEAGYLLLELSQQIDATLNKQDHAVAVKYLRALAKMTPDNALAFAKLCASYRALGDRNNALVACQRATRLPGVTPADVLRYAELLLQTPEGAAISPAEVAELDAVFGHLQSQGVEGPTIEQLKCHLAVKLEDANRLKGCVQQLVEKQPDNPLTLTYQLSLALLERDFAAARNVVAAARKQQLPESAIAFMESKIDETRCGPKGCMSATQWLMLGLGVGAAGGLGGLFTWLRRKRRGAVAAA